jgi:hypothetical protein
MRKIYFFAAVALALAACDNDDKYADNEPVAARITANIGNSVSSRAAGTAWATGDKIGITTHRGSESKYVNMEYTTENGDGKFTGTPMYFQDAQAEVTFTAYYPFTGSEGTAPAIVENNTRAEQQTPGNQPKFDYLWDSRVGKKGQPNINFEFAHKMSKITMTFQDGEGTQVNKIESYSFDGLVLEGTFNPATGEAKAKEMEAETLTLNVDNVISGSARPSIIVYPQATSGKVVLRIVKDNQTYKCELTFAGGELKAGTDYQYTITLNKTGADVTKSEIHPWSSQIGTGDATME